MLSMQQAVRTTLSPIFKFRTFLVRTFLVAPLKEPGAMKMSRSCCACGAENRLKWTRCWASYAFDSMFELEFEALILII